MDTKSKKYNYSYGIKIAAFILAIVLGFSSAFFAIKTINNLFLYGSSIVLKPKDATDVTTTSAFASSIIDDLLSVYVASDMVSWEEFKEQKYKTYDMELQSAREKLESLKEKRMSEAINRYYSSSADQEEDALYYGNGGDSASETTGASLQNSTAQSFDSTNNIVTKYDAEFYNSCTENISLTTGATVKLSTTMTEGDLQKSIREAYELGISSAKREYETRGSTERKNIESLKNFKFYIVNSETGESYTNMGDISEGDAAEKIKNYGWHLGFSVSNGLFMSSEQVTRTTLYSSSKSTSNYYNITGQYYNIYPESSTINSVLDNCFSNNGYNVYLLVDTDYPETDKYSNLQNAFENSGEEAYNSILISIICLILVIFISFYLLFVTGHVNGYEGIKLSWIDKVPTDLHLLVSGGLATLAFAGAGSLAGDYSYYFQGYSDTEIFLMFSAMAACAAAFWAVVMEWLMSTARYYKIKRNWIFSTLTFWLFKQIVKFFKFMYKKTKNFAGLFSVRLTTLSKSSLWYCAGYIFVNIVLLGFMALSVHSAGTLTFFVLLLLAFNLIVLSVLWKYIRSLDNIISESENTKNGKPPKNLSTEKMPKALKILARNLYFTQDEMSKAVSEAVKGEKMKTELITNVSHDLKTPLTSIISYVDLLKKCDIDDISAQKYITVLDEKSARLKRLIEDLVEASKASSGAVTFNKMNVNFHELAVQAIGEMEDVFEERHLEIVLEDNPSPPVIFADSQKTWRVIDNLLNNVKKYALEGTRVYVNVSKEGDYGVFTIKNTSREALNIDPEELTNRFVRGDESRTLEGSGLGLSIAKDLCTLQGGELNLSIDGDLFKAVVKMPLVKIINSQGERPENSEENQKSPKQIKTSPKLKE